MRILIATDAFPPHSGGSGWSTYELARGLRDRGHELVVVRVSAGESIATRSREFDRFVVDELAFWAPDVPFARNWFKNERLYRRAAHVLAGVIRRRGIDIVHAQHRLSGPPAIAAATAAAVPVVCTVRDYWPVCYWSDLIHDPSAANLCPACSTAMMTRCVRPRSGAAWPFALPLIPYMQRNLAAKRRRLSEADAIVAVSSTIARDLRARAPEIARTRLEVIPNPVDVRALADARAAEPPMAGPYALYVGKLATNKGTRKLGIALDRARLAWPLVVVGDGPDRGRLEAELGRAGRNVRFTGWLPRDEAIGWMRHASLLVFPSHGPESLSRVLIEASALGVPIAAMDTRGPRDIITPGVTGLLATTPEELGDAVARLAGDADLRRALGRAAAAAASRFDREAIAERMEALYVELRTTQDRPKARGR